MGSSRQSSQTSGIVGGSSDLGGPREHASRTAFNSIFAELAGAGVAISVNYDRIVNDYFSVRAGLGVAPGHDNKGATATIPLIGNLLLGNDNPKFEAGAGFCIFAAQAYQDQPANFVLHVGYRYAPAEGGFNFRAGAELLAAIGGKGYKDTLPNLAPWGGVSFGYGF
jgi:hypothetical protein